jgi:sensor c-di-GMP phosphodiesterase-like protein
MNRRILVLFALVIVLSLYAGSALAADQERAQERVQKQEQEQIYGSQLMTQQERAEYSAKMRTAKTAEEREQIRKEHHARMKERAAERSVTLTEEPPARGSGMGSCGEQMGSGGAGMGPRGGGMGSGGRRGR